MRIIMKAVICVVVAVCAVVQGAVFENKPADLIETRLTNTNLETTLISKQQSYDVDVEGKTSRNFLEDSIKEFLHSFRDVIQNGNEDLPPLDPLEIDQVGPFAFSANGFRGTISANDINFNGIGWYVIDDVTFNVLRLALGIHVTVPWINFTGGYDAQVRALFINHRAGGNIRVFLNHIQFGVDLRMGTSIMGGGHLVLRELNIKLVVHDAIIRIDGLTGSSLINSAINSFIHNLTQDVIQNQLDVATAAASEALFETVNDILSQYTLQDLLG